MYSTLIALSLKQNRGTEVTRVLIGTEAFIKIVPKHLKLTLLEEKAAKLTNWKAICKNVPWIFRPFLKVLKTSWILACGLCFTWETLLWSFFSLGCFSFSGNNVCKKGTQVGKTEWFIAYTISRERSELWCKNYGTLLNIPERNCMRNLERFRQSSLLIKILDAFSRRVRQINEARPLLW